VENDGDIDENFKQAYVIIEQAINKQIEKDREAQSKQAKAKRGRKR